MGQLIENAAIDRLAVFVGEWGMAAEFKDLPPADIGARVVFEWMPGRRFLIQRWQVPVPEAPDGIAIIGADPESEGNLLQHYCDSRGVARVYKMSVSDRGWKLWRHTPDFSPLVVLGLVATLKTLNVQITELERQLASSVREHPDGHIFLSLFKKPGSVICAAELLAEIGDCRARYLTRDAVAADAGQAAVAVESGKRKAASFRWACNKRLRNAFHTLADSTRHWHPWAQDLYASASARARGQDHRRALRTLGRAWSRIVWRCWQDHLAYDPPATTPCNGTSP